MSGGNSSYSLLKENRTFRRLLFGRALTNIADSLYVITAMWLVHELTGSPLFTGIAGFLFRLPLILQFVTGPIVDSISLRPLLVITQLIQGVVILVIPLAALADVLSVWLILVLIPVLAMINQFVYPAQNAALPRIVSQHDITKANSMFSFAYRGIDLVANAAAGIIIAVVGALVLFTVNSVAFFVAAMLFSSVLIPRADTDTPDGEVETPNDRGALREYLTELREGFEYIRQSLFVHIVVSAAIANFALGITFAVLPDYAETMGGAQMYGFMMAAIAGGSLLGIIVSNWLEQYPFGIVQIIIFVPGAVVWIAAISVQTVPITLVLFTLAWIPVGIFNVMNQSVRQIAVPEDLIGRVTSASVSAASVASPVGSLLGGALATAIGSETTLMITGIGYFSIAGMFAGMAALRTLPPITKIGPDDVLSENSRWSSSRANE